MGYSPRVSEAENNAAPTAICRKSRKRKADQTPEEKRRGDEEEGAREPTQDRWHYSEEETVG
jgi:hypothetical protein